MAKVTKQEVAGIGAKTISFVKGRGNLNHNNREFICKNVHEERVQWNKIYKRETLKEAYDYCFGNALAEYNSKQKRKDRIKQDYIHEIEHSGNKEKVFYENVVQIGKMEDTAVTDENGNLAEAAVQVIKVLDEYARTFQERNPNLYMFNCVLHLDEATPHLHIDYIPVAHGYKTGLGTRNSLTKAFRRWALLKQQESVIMKQWHGKGGKGNICNIYVLDKVLKLKHLELSVTIILFQNIKKQWKSQTNCKSRQMKCRNR